MRRVVMVCVLNGDADDVAGTSKDEDAGAGVEPVLVAVVVVAADRAKGGTTLMSPAATRAPPPKGTNDTLLPAAE